MDIFIWYLLYCMAIWGKEKYNIYEIVYPQLYFVVSFTFFPH